MLEAEHQARLAALEELTKGISNDMGEEQAQTKRSRDRGGGQSL
jgi:hypothetical protein